MSARRLVQVYLATNPGAHLRDGLIVDKVGIGATREPLYSPDSKSTQNGSRQKINPESVAYFSTQNTTINSPRNHHNPTTNSPSRNHVSPPFFPKKPLQKHKNWLQR
jgi:hypothetical protein